MIKKLSLLLLLPTLGCATKIERVIANSQDKIVKIGVVLADGSHGSGSGAFIDSKGRVLTCAHVVHDLDIVKIFVKRSNGITTPAVVIKIDNKHDLAVLYTGFYDTPYFKLGHQVKVGQQVVTFGYPLGIASMVAVGYVEALIKKGMEYVVHGASILPGNSGGPLVDLHGRLVGVNEAILMLNPFSPAPGYCIAIDVSEVISFLRRK